MDTHSITALFTGWLTASKQWLVVNIFTLDSLVQLIVILLAFAASLLSGRKLGRRLKLKISEGLKAQARLFNFIQTALDIVPFYFMIVFLYVGILASEELDSKAEIFNLVETVIVAWVIIKLATSIILDRNWSKLIALSAWTLAFLHILGLLQPGVEFLDTLGFRIGDIQLTVLSIIKGVILLTVLMKAGFWIGDYFDKKLQNISGLTPSAHVLLSKAVKISVFCFVFIIALSSIGIDFSALAVFSGAVGVGVGFGLQKVVANLISGIILLVDKSIKPGDVIQLGDVYGWITNLKGRYVSVVTRDGKEYLIPNEDLITQQVINWSFSNQKIRLKIPVGVSYNSDLNKAISLVLKSAENLERVLDDPRPRCNVLGFGDNSVDLELRIWIDDPQNGVANIKSRILLNIWDNFKANNIAIPFPQRDLHFDADTPIKIVTSSETSDNNR